MFLLYKEVQRMSSVRYTLSLVFDSQMVPVVAGSDQENKSGSHHFCS